MIQDILYPITAFPNTESGAQAALLYLIFDDKELSDLNVTLVRALSLMVTSSLMFDDYELAVNDCTIGKDVRADI
jgi:hypothetical protein